MPAPHQARPSSQRYRIQHSSTATTRGATIKHSNNHRNDNLPYETVSRGLAAAGDFSDLSNIQDIHGSVARITCGCGAHADRPIPAGKMNPFMIVKFFEGAGWKQHGNEDSRNWSCAECMKSRKAKSKGQSPKDTIQLPANIQAHFAVLTPIVVEPPTPPEPEMPKCQLQKIAKMLEIYYDASARVYLMGMSDELIAKQLGVTAADVRKVRMMDTTELVHGTVDNELTVMEKMIAGIKTKMDEAMERLGEIDAELHEATTRYADLRRIVKPNPVTALAAAAE